MSKRKSTDEQSNIVTAVKKQGGEESIIYKLNSPEGAPVIEQIAALIIGKVAAPLIQVAWQTILTWIIAACRFTSVNSDITAEHFPLQPGDLEPKPVEVVSIKERLKTLGREWLNTQEVIDYLAELGYRPATLVELLYWWITAF